MTAPALSVIVVSRHRQTALVRCIAGLLQQDHPAMELIVVADPAATQAVRATGLPIKCIAFDEANISAARNLGLGQAAADVVSFIDDDAVPEPTWARRLAEPFFDPDVHQAGGFVIGRNGISYQWRAMQVDARGQDQPLAVPDAVSLHHGSAVRAVKTQGTCCAFRRAPLLAIGGFDPALRFYLDEADVNLRLAARGGLTAVVPCAVVHHGMAAGAQRRADRVPLTLHEIGASTAVFLRRHAPGAAAAELEALRAAQRRRLLRQMVQGGLEPRDVARLDATLDAGIAEGLTRPLAVFAPLAAVPDPFCPLRATGPSGGTMLGGWAWRRRGMMQAALRARTDGAVVTVLLLSAGLRRHRMRFGDEGIWWQTGGIFGASDRADPVFRAWRMRARLAREMARLSPLRPISRRA